MKRRVAVDSGPLIALFDPSDRDHRKAIRFFSDATMRGFVTSAVVTEITHLLDYRDELPVKFLRWLARGALAIEEVAGDLDRIIELMAKYMDVPMSFADATIVAASERLGIRDVATLDSDFLVYRLHGRQAFQNHFPR